MQLIFQLRSRNLPLKCNFPSQYNDRKCIVNECSDEDSQSDLYTCKFLEPLNIIKTNDLEYHDIFGDEVTKQVSMMNLIMRKYESRLTVLSSQQ